MLPSLPSFKIKPSSGLQSARLEGERDIFFPIKFERALYQAEITRRHRINSTPLDSIRRNRETIGTGWNRWRSAGNENMHRYSLFSTFNSLPRTLHSLSPFYYPFLLLQLTR